MNSGIVAQLRHQKLPYEKGNDDRWKSCGHCRAQGEISALRCRHYGYQSTTTNFRFRTILMEVFDRITSPKFMTGKLLRGDGGTQVHHAGFIQRRGGGDGHNTCHGTDYGHHALIDKFAAGLPGDLRFLLVVFHVQSILRPAIPPLLLNCFAISSTASLPDRPRSATGLEVLATKPIRMGSFVLSPPSKATAINNLEQREGLQDGIQWLKNFIRKPPGAF